MIPTKTDVVITGSLGGERRPMGIDPESMAHIISVLTDLYSDPALAVIREYSTNAKDAHIEAGQTRSIEITRPSNFSRYFVVKDFGVGLTVDEMFEVYGMYGTSTKRGTDTQTGMLGLGCKSALTYTNQFTVIAVKNGVRVLTSVSRGEDGVPTMEVVDTAATDEENGVQVSIPVQNVSQFNGKIDAFFKFWNPADVLIDGNKIESPSMSKVTNKTYMLDKYSEQSYLVMGGVSYPIDIGYFGLHRRNGTAVVVLADIGDVSFTPSREALNYNDHTKRFIRDESNEFKAVIQKRIQDEIDSATTYRDAFKVYRKWKEKVSVPNLTYKGSQPPRQKDVPEYTTWNPGRRWQNTTRSKFLTIDSCDNINIVVGLPPGIPSTHQRSRVTAAFGESRTTWFFEKLPNNPWFDLFTVKTWEQVKEETKKEPQSRQSRDRVLPYGVIDTRMKVTERELKPKEPLVYYDAIEAQNNSTVQGWLKKFAHDHVIVKVPGNRKNKFLRDHPGAVHYRDLVDQIYKDEWEKIEPHHSYDANLGGWNSQMMYRVLREFTGEKILDPEVLAEIEIIKALDKRPATVITVLNSMRQSVSATVLKAYPMPKFQSFKSLQKYPLVTAVGESSIRSVKKDLILYMNAKYKESSEI